MGLKLSVRNLLTLLFLLIVGLWLGLRVYQTRLLEGVESAVDFLAREAGREAEEINELQTSLQDYHALWNETRENPRPSDRRALLINRRRFQDVLSRVSPATVAEREETHTASLSKLYFEATQSALGETMLGEGQRERIEQLYQQILREVSDIHDAYEAAQTKIKTQGALIVENQREKDLVFLVVSLAGLAALTGAVWFLLGAPLTELARGVRLLARQKWEEPMKVRGFGELAELMRAFNAMAETIKHQKEELVEEATTDELTGLLNFRAFQDRMQEELSRAERLGKPLSLILADIDFFKKFNDTRGHLAGNDALKDIADRIRKGTRRYDVVARFGGEEFAVVMPETDTERASMLAERIRKFVASNGFHLTISCGVASYPGEASNLDQLIAQADRKLYRAKAEGRNRVVA